MYPDLWCSSKKGHRLHGVRVFLNSRHLWFFQLLLWTWTHFFKVTLGGADRGVVDQLKVSKKVSWNWRKNIEFSASKSNLNGANFFFRNLQSLSLEVKVSGKLQQKFLCKSRKYVKFVRLRSDRIGRQMNHKVTIWSWNDQSLLDRLGVRAKNLPRKIPAQITVK